MRRRAADAVLDSQVRAVFAARSGMAALTGVMEELGARTLSAATLGTVADADASANTKRVQLKLFSNILTVISEYLNAEAGRALPANMSVLRGVYAGIVSSMNIVMGDAYAQTTHTQALSNLYTDPAAGEHCSADASQAGPAASASASAALWAAPAHAVALSTADADALPVEEV
ncbi:hypothetical protein EON67_06440 [archaeon]|nr:MAG: hypothetical protein EON67_06440 [archaeon]